MPSVPEPELLEAVRNVLEAWLSHAMKNPALVTTSMTTSLWYAAKYVVANVMTPLPNVETI
jgi:spore coat protein CotF